MSYFSAKLQFIKVHLLNATPLQRKVLGGGIWAVIGKVTLSSTGLILSAILARILPPEEMGAYFIALSILSVIGVFTSLGLNQTIVRVIAESMATERPGRARRVIEWAFTLLLIGCLLGAGFMLLGGGKWITEHIFHSPLLSDLIGLIALWVVLSTIQTMLAEAFRGFHDIRLAASFSGGGALTRLVLLILLAMLWLWRDNSNLYQIMILSITANVITVLLAAMFLGSRISNLPSSNEILPREIITISWPLWVNSVGLLILNQADIWILGASRLSSEVAIYGVIFRLAILGSTPLLIINAVLPPIIAELYSIGEKHKLERILRSSTTMVSIPAIILFGTFLFYGKNILSILYGEQYINGYPILIILSFGQMINALTGSCGNLMIMSGYQKQFMNLTIVVSLLSLGLQYIFVPKLGIMASAILSAGNIIFIALLAAFYSQFYIGVRTWPGRLWIKKDE